MVRTSHFMCVPFCFLCIMASALGNGDLPEVGRTSCIPLSASQVRRQRKHFRIFKAGIREATATPHTDSDSAGIEKSFSPSNDIAGIEQSFLPTHGCPDTHNRDYSPATPAALVLEGEHAQLQADVASSKMYAVSPKELQSPLACRFGR